jgi:hypothetical protein
MALSAVTVHPKLVAYFWSCSTNTRLCGVLRYFRRALLAATRGARLTAAAAQFSGALNFSGAQCGRCLAEQF